VLNVVGPGADPAAFLPALARRGEPVWLKAGHAFDIPFDRDAPTALRAARHIADGSFDINVIPAAYRRKKLLVADMDSTIVGCECLDEVARMAGHGPQVAAITERAMRGEVDFADALRERVALLKGVPVEVLARVYAERVRLNAGARTLVATMRANGAKTILVSGGFTYFTARVMADAGFDSQHANRLLDHEKRLTGKVAEPILGREAKLLALENAVAANGLTFDETLAVGDGANDLDMVKRAGLGVAWHAKPILAEAADAVIAHGDLTALLYLQGYREEEFIR
jgi:phosphoserine phosphatase